MRALDPLRGEVLIILSNFLIQVFDGSLRWPSARRKEFDRLLLQACRDELRRRSEVERAADRAGAVRQPCLEGAV